MAGFLRFSPLSCSRSILRPSWPRGRAIKSGLAMGSVAGYRFFTGRRHPTRDLRMLTAQTIVKVAPAAELYAKELLKQMAEAGILANASRASKFLGQIHVESGGFRRVVESLDYAADSDMMRRFVEWGRISAADAQRFGRTAEHPAHQNALANILYGGAFGRKQLGNTEAGDGWRFRGRGLKQLTGRENYRRFSLAWQGDDSLLRTPDRVAEPDGAVASAIWFWASRQLNEIADRGSVADVTHKVNGGDVGLKEREKWTTAYRQAMTGG